MHTFTCTCCRAHVHTGAPPHLHAQAPERGASLKAQFASSPMGPRAPTRLTQVPHHKSVRLFPHQCRGFLTRMEARMCLCESARS